MRHRFSLVYEIDAPLAISVAVYLDAEHYIFLHRKYSDTYEILSHDEKNRRIVIRQAWSLFGLKVGDICTCEYRPPATFLNYDLKPIHRWLPSVHHLMSTRTELTYTEIKERNSTLSTLVVELDMPFWLYPFRRQIQRAIERLKIEKDQQDIDMMKRRAALFGRENNSAYLAEHQFLLHKEEYVRNFGPNSKVLSPT